MELPDAIHAACIKVAGDWAIQIATWDKQRQLRGEHKNGYVLLQENFQKAYQYLIKTVEK